MTDAAPPGYGWLPIAQAPRDGQWVLGLFKNDVGFWMIPWPVRFSTGMWIDGYGLTPTTQRIWQPTHFQYLPAVMPDGSILDAIAGPSPSEPGPKTAP